MVRRRPRPGHPRGVTPQVLEVVVGAGLVHEDVDQEVAVVHQDPVGVVHALDLVGQAAAGLLHLALHLVDDRLDLTGVAPVGHDEGVGHPEEVTHGEDDRLLPRLGVGGAGGHEALVGDVGPGGPWGGVGSVVVKGCLLRAAERLGTVRRWTGRRRTGRRRTGWRR